MRLNLTGLTAYVDQEKMALIRKSILGGKTVDIINVQPEIKNAAAINIIGSTLTAQAGACGFNAQGSTALTQRNIVVDDIKVNESICLNDLEAYYTSKSMKPGSYNEQIPFEGLFAEEKSAEIQKLIEDLVWKGDKATGVGNLLLSDGFIKLLATGTVGVTKVAITTANAIAQIDAVIAATPTDIIDADNLVLFLGYDTYRTAATALRNSNLFHYTGAEENFEMVWPGTNVKLVATRGLNGSGNMYLSTADNFYMGTDLLSDSEDFSIWYSKDNDEVRFSAKWKQGVQVAFPSLVVAYK